MNTSRSERLRVWLRARLFPPRCFVCSKLLDLYDPKERESALCRECYAKWSAEREEGCPICGEPISRCACMTEGMKKAKCKSFRRLVYYRRGIGDPVQNRVIYRFKFYRNRRASDFLASQLFPALQELMEAEGMTPENTFLVPIPRSRAAYLEHGTDQAEELARAMARCSGLSVLRVFCNAARTGKKQKELSAEERFRNARRSYRVRPKLSLRGKHIILLDDIVTTGATVSACATKLSRRGCLGIYCLAIASDDL